MVGKPSFITRAQYVGNLPPPYLPTPRGDKSLQNTSGDQLAQSTRNNRLIQSQSLRKRFYAYSLPWLMSALRHTNNDLQQKTGIRTTRGSRVKISLKIQRYMHTSNQKNRYFTPCFNFKNFILVLLVTYTRNTYKEPH